MRQKTIYTKQTAKQITNKTAKTEIPSNLEAVSKVVKSFDFREFLAREYPKIQVGLGAFLRRFAPLRVAGRIFLAC